MTSQPSPNLIAILRATIEEVEQSSGVPPEDPGLVELKNILNRRVADLQHAMAKELSEPASKPAMRNELDPTDDSICELAS